jgi:hypothetical protein
MSQSAQSPLARFIVFMVMLSVAGSILAGFHYYAVDLPQQKELQPPKNEYNGPMKDCLAKCDADYNSCTPTPDPRYPDGDSNLCDNTHFACQTQCVVLYRNLPGQ